MKRPQLNREEAQRYLDQKHIKDPVVVLGIRGYYRKTMGDPTKNDRGLYDDALFILAPDYFQTFNANTDPSKYGKNKEGNGIATLTPGIWKYRPGIHHPSSPNGYPAFIQADQVSVTRDGSDRTFTGYFGINIHKGSINSTSSEGCQTIYPSQWLEFHDNLVSQLKKASVSVFSYLLITQE